MITAPDDTWRYFGPPRTGSTVLHTLLQKPPFCGQPSGQQHDIVPLEGAKYIASVRNPYARAVSLWKFRRYELGLDRYGRQGEDRRIVPLSEADYPFHVYLNCAVGAGDFHRLGLADWLKGIPGKLELIHLERINEDFGRIFCDTILGFCVPTENTSNGAEICRPPYADARCIELVERDFPDDFERFGYRKGDVPAGLR
jgi:hypothetical protein